MQIQHAARAAAPQQGVVVALLSRHLTVDGPLNAVPSRTPPHLFPTRDTACPRLFESFGMEAHSVIGGAAP